MHAWFPSADATKLLPTLCKALHKVGKTFLARHLAFGVLKSGYSVIFARADKMFRHLKISIVDGTHDRTVCTYLRPDLLIIDDFAIRFPDPILGNSILDRLCHSSYRILMEGESIRKQNRPK